MDGIYMSGLPNSWNGEILRAPLVLAAALAFCLTGGNSKAAEPDVDAKLTGNVVGCEHFAFVRAKVAEGLAGPAREAAKSWHIVMDTAADGTAYALDAENCQIYRIRGGQVRVLAGDGIRGYRDGPADRARFDFGVGSYQDADVKVDRAGNLLVSEGVPARLRKITRDEHGWWHVATVAGGGDKMPEKGETIAATDMRFGCSSKFALAADGSVYFATYGGVYRVHDGKGSLVISKEDLLKQLGVERLGINDWHVGGCHVTPSGDFYWMPGGGPKLLRVNVESGKAESFAGIDQRQRGLDGPDLSQSGFRTVFVAYSPNAKAIFTGGGDEDILRRIASGRAAHLQKDGSFLPNGRKNGWHLYSPLCVDRAGRLYTETGIYAWGGFIVRVNFAARAETK